MSLYYHKSSGIGGQNRGQIKKKPVTEVAKLGKFTHTKIQILNETCYSHNILACSAVFPFKTVIKYSY